MPFAKQMSGGVIVEKPLSAKELKFIQAQYVLPWQSLGLSFGLTHLGNREYRQSRLEILAGKNLGKVNVGLGLNYRQTGFTGYGKETQLGVCAGLLMELNEQTNYFNNIIIRSKAEADRSKVEQIVNGLEYALSDQVCIGIAAIKNQDNEMMYQFNCIYRPVNLIDIDIGMITGISTVYLCIKYRWKNISVRSGFRFGQFIGIVPGMGVIFGREFE
ncbi:MAG: hypothetical protein ACXWV5_00990 [Flavitalea sp.]